MSELPPIDLESLLQPISEREPAGEWLRYEGTYDAIAEARREEDDSLPQGVWQIKVKRADFAKVSQLGQKALRERSKDLQIAVWLCEAWLKLHGVSGMTLGIKLCTQLMTRFWGSLYPLVEEGDSSYRMAPLELLSGKISLRLKEMFLTEPYGERPAFTWIDWERALRNEKTSSTGEEILPAVFLAAAANTSGRFYSARYAELSALDEASRELEDFVVAKLPDQPAILRTLRNLIRDIQALIAQYTPAPAVPEEPSQSSDVAVSSDGSATHDEPSEAAMHGDGSSPGRPAARGDVRGEESASGPIRSRVQAYQRLVEAAEYLQRTEPHSPVPYLVKRAVAWGNMDLIQLLGELVAEGGDRQTIYALLGVKGPQ
ncbi:MAG: type VI secretion system protein TssA [Myxococcales bacterium]|nr:type VI secretion system protein TssA [Myxococcales bacterium]